MAAQAYRSGLSQSRWVRPLMPIVVVLAGAIVFLFIGGALAALRSDDATPLDFAGVLPYLLGGCALVYGIAALAGDQDLWEFGARELVCAALGAALYGGLSWATSWLPVQMLGSLTLRPAIVVPIFFGVAFGPAVGFFSGFVGNVLGEALLGWGVFPVWDLGNGLIGLLAGMALAFASHRRGLNVLQGVVAVVCVWSCLQILRNPMIVDPFGDGLATVSVGGLWWQPLLGLALLVGVRALAFRHAAIASAQVWGALGIVVGIGFAALADMPLNGYSFSTALLGEFVPVAGAYLVNALIALPIALAAWQWARARLAR